MKILEHFTTEKQIITTISLKKVEYDIFLNKLPEHYLFSYITLDQIQKHKKEYGSNSQDIFDEYIPNDPKLMSGEFGEILCQNILIELYELQGLAIDGMKKTLHKEAKNVANHGTDIVLFYLKDKLTPSPDDILISAEVKSKATLNKESSLAKAVKGVETDNISRLAETLIWIRRKYKEENNKDGYESIKRFIDPTKTTKYLKHFKAMAVIDKQFLLHEEVKPITLDLKDDFERIIVLIDDLKETYQKTLLDTIKHIENV